jgi:hypothetical protein
MDFKPIKLQSEAYEMRCSKYYSEMDCCPLERSLYLYVKIAL